MKTIIYIILISAVAMISCEKIIDIDVPDSEKRIVVNSLLAEDSTLTINISQSLNILDNKDIKYLNEADVKLYEDDTYLFDLTNQGDGNYTSDFYPQLGKEYKVEVENSPLKKAIGTCFLPTPIEIISVDTSSFVRHQEDMVECRVRFEDPGTDENYYMVMVRAIYYYTDYDETYVFDEDMWVMTFDPIVEEYDWKSGDIMFSDDIIDGKTHDLVLEVFEDDLFADSCFLEIYLKSVSKDYYLYALSYTKHQRTTDNPFAEPVQVYSNIENGFGIFGGLSVSKHTIKFVGYGEDVFEEEEPW